MSSPGLKLMPPLAAAVAPAETVAAPQPKPVVTAPATPAKLPPPKVVVVSPPASEPAVQPSPLPKKASGATLLTAPGGGLSGKLLVVDEAGRFVVVNFPLGQMPGMNQTLNVSRHGVKVGEVLVTGPQRDDSIVADVVAGELQVGDAVRSR
jgi:hypothetical protein